MRISVLAQSRQQVKLKLEGWVSGEDVALLEREGGSWLQKAESLVVDMEEVRFIDGRGIALLERWTKEGVMLQGCSLFIRELLKTHGLGQEPNGH